MSVLKPGPGGRLT